MLQNSSIKLHHSEVYPATFKIVSAPKGKSISEGFIEGAVTDGTYVFDTKGRIAPKVPRDTMKYDLEVMVYDRLYKLKYSSLPKELVYPKGFVIYD